MKLLSPLLVSILIVPCSAINISPEVIAVACSNDSGRTQEQYFQYGERLANTLSQYSAEQLAKIFTEPTVVSNSEVESDPLPVSLTEGSETVNEFLELGPINFASGTSDLTSSALQELTSVFLFLTENESARILIEGHSATSGRRSQQVSEDRANAARDYLIEMGVDPDRIESIGLDASEPLIPNATREERWQNMRIEIELIGH